MEWTAELKLATEAARAAGARLAEIMRGHKEILSDAGRDIKLQADRDAERIILDLLQARSPYPALAEESGEHGAPAEGPFWVIDPLDGTLNFSRGVPMCCVSIALVAGQTPLLGVIYDFNRNELYYGVEGGPSGFVGADGVERPLAVSAVRDSRRGILATGFPTNRDYGDAALQDMFMEIKRFKKVRMLGTAALMLAYVASGRVDAYAEDEIMLWDVAAGLALVKAAGGYVDIRPSSKMKWARRVRVASHANVWEGSAE